MHPRQMRETVIPVLPSKEYCISLSLTCRAAGCYRMAGVKHSTDRILTTHAGRLDGASMTEVIRRQSDAGVDIISDGELGKIGFGFAYYGRRLSGLATRKTLPGESGWMGGQSGERAEFAEFYKDLNFE